MLPVTLRCTATGLLGVYTCGQWRSRRVHAQPGATPDASAENCAVFPLPVKASRFREVSVELFLRV